MTRDWDRRGTIGGLAAVSLLGTAAGVRASPAAPVSPELRTELAPSGRLRVAINLDNVVLAHRQADGAAGPAVDLAHELARRLGVEAELMLYPSARVLVAQLAADRWDITFMGIDPARAEAIAFTPPYLFIDGSYAVRADTPYAHVADLDREGARIAVGQGAAYDLFLSRTLRHAALVRSPTGATAMAQFVSDRLDAVAGIRQALLDFARATPGTRVLPDSFNRIEQAAAIPKGRDRGYAWLVATLETLKADGFLRAALDRAGQTGVPLAPPARVALTPRR